MPYWYHYTTIDTLALILKSKAIRFNSLCKVDDSEEQYMDDIGNVGNSVLVSCWTRDNAESIPLWKMYSEDFCGCRIQIIENMFSFVTHEVSDDHYIVLNEFRDDANLLLVPNSFLRDINYVNTFSERKLKSADKVYIVGTLGREKSLAWKFQKECRFYIYQFHNKQTVHKIMNSAIRIIYPHHGILFTVSQAKACRFKLIFKVRSPRI